MIDLGPLPTAQPLQWIVLDGDNRVMAVCRDAISAARLVDGVTDGTVYFRPTVEPPADADVNVWREALDRAWLGPAATIENVDVIMRRRAHLP